MEIKESIRVDLILVVTALFIFFLSVFGVFAFDIRYSFIEWVEIYSTVSILVLSVLLAVLYWRLLEVQEEQNRIKKGLGKILHRYSENQEKHSEILKAEHEPVVEIIEWEVQQVTPDGGKEEKNSEEKLTESEDLEAEDVDEETVDGMDDEKGEKEIDNEEEKITDSMESEKENEELENREDEASSVSDGVSAVEESDGEEEEDGSSITGSTGFDSGMEISNRDDVDRGLENRGEVEPETKSPYFDSDFEYRLSLLLSNPGNGVAKNLCIEFSIDYEEGEEVDDELMKEVESNTIPLEPVNEDPRWSGGDSGGVIRAGESEKEFRAPVKYILTEGISRENTGFESVVDQLFEQNIDEFNFGFILTYETVTGDERKIEFFEGYVNESLLKQMVGNPNAFEIAVENTRDNEVL